MNSCLICEMDEDDRPREKLLSRGASSLSNAELLALFFGTGRQGMSAVDLGRELLQQFGSLRKLSRAALEEFTQCNGIGPAKAAQLAALCEFSQRLANETFEKKIFRSAEDVYHFTAPHMQHLPHEEVRVILLDVRKNFISMNIVSKGSRKLSVADPSDILRPAIIQHADSFVLVHNHPSGDCTPSKPDTDLTKRVQVAAKALSIEFADHVIVGSESDDGTSPFFSFRNCGLM